MNSSLGLGPKLRLPKTDKFAKFISVCKPLSKNSGTQNRYLFWKHMSELNIQFDIWPNGNSNLNSIKTKFYQHTVTIFSFSVFFFGMVNDDPLIIIDELFHYFFSSQNKSCPKP